MENHNRAGYLEIAHTADWELKVWGEDMQDLMIQAAKGMYSITGMKLADKESGTRAFEILILDRESVLVDFLTELLFFSEHERIAFTEFTIKQKEEHYAVQASGRQILEQIKEIKAVTYHDLNIKETEAGLEVNIVFDV